MLGSSFDFRRKPVGSDVPLQEGQTPVEPTLTSARPRASAPFRKAHVIVVGNEKGGSGKTTTTMHLIVGLLRLGFSVGSMDIDSRQRSLSRYVENRRETVAREGISLPLPHHVIINKSPFATQEETIRDERERFAQGLAQIYATCDFVVIDTPGNDTYLSRLAHSFADTVITPINDSFVDLDVLASVDGKTLNIIRPSIYSEMVWEQKLQRAKRDGGSMDWIVMRNRLSHLDARNKRFMAKVTEELARRIGFRLAPGFSERVIFREMFLQGLTVLDVIDEETGVNVSMSHIAARQEVRDLLKCLGIEAIDRRIGEIRDGKAQEDATPAEETSAATKAEAKTEIEAGVNAIPEEPAATPVATEATQDKTPVAIVSPIALATSSEAISTEAQTGTKAKIGAEVTVAPEEDTDTPVATETIPENAPDAAISPIMLAASSETKPEEKPTSPPPATSEPVLELEQAVS